jgi:hypothetical protein
MSTIHRQWIQYTMFINSNAFSNTFIVPSHNHFVNSPSYESFHQHDHIAGKTMSDMDVEITSQQSTGSDAVTSTVTEVLDEEAVQTSRPRRPLFRRRMTEPVSHLRKRKWAPSRHSSPPPKRDAAFRGDIITCNDDDFLVATGPNGSPSQEKHHRRQSSTAGRVFGTLKKLLRKDSQQVESSLPERRHITPDQDEYGQVAADGLLNLPNVSEYFNTLGEHGPSNYYETDRWAVFHSPKEGSRGRRGKSHSPNTRSSTVRTPTSHKPSKTRAADGTMTPKHQKHNQRGTFPVVESPESSAWRKDILHRKPKKLSEKALGKQPELTPKEIQLHPNMRPVKIAEDDPRQPTTLPMTFDAPRPKYDLPSARPPSSYCNPQWSFSDESSNHFSSSYSLSTQNSPERQHSKIPSQEVNHDYSTSYSVPCHPQPLRPHIHCVLTGRPDTAAYYLEAIDASHNNHTQRSTPSPRHSTLHMGSFEDLINNRPQLSPHKNSTTSPHHVPTTIAHNDFAPKNHTPKPKSPSAPLNTHPPRTPPTHTYTTRPSNDSIRITPSPRISRPHTPTGHHIVSRSTSHEQMPFPMSPCVSRQDLTGTRRGSRNNDGFGGTWLEEHVRAGGLRNDMQRRRGSTGLPEGVYIERGRLVASVLGTRAGVEKGVDLGFEESEESERMSVDHPAGECRDEEEGGKEGERWVSGTRAWWEFNGNA